MKQKYPPGQFAVFRAFFSLARACVNDLTSRAAHYIALPTPSYSLTMPDHRFFPEDILDVRFRVRRFPRALRIISRDVSQYNIQYKAQLSVMLGRVLGNAAFRSSLPPCFSVCFDLRAKQQMHG